MAVDWPFVDTYPRERDKALEICGDYAHVEDERRVARFRGQRDECRAL